MAQNKKQVAQKQPEQSRSNQRQSDSFVYNSDIERHIGKRTGNYYGRVNPKQNFDGFPRFSQYESHRNTESSSLAKQLENTSNISSHIVVDAHEPDIAPFDQPFQAKQSPITGVPPLDPVTRHSSSRIHAAPLPGFGFGVGHQNYEISTIKRRSSTVRPSQVKSYRDLLVDLEADQFKQFIFNDNQIQYIASSAEKQKQKQKQQQKWRVSQQQGNQIKKKKKESRVSFKDKPIEYSMNSNSKKQSSVKIQYQDKQSTNRVQIKQEKQQKQKRPVGNQTVSLKSNDVIKKQQSVDFNDKNNDEQDINYYTNADDNHETNQDHKRGNKVEKQQEPTNRRKSKKQLRITDSPQTQSNANKQEVEKRSKKQSKKPAKQVKAKKSSKQSLDGRITKVRSKSQQNEYIEQLTSSPNQQESNERYPRRIRIKPVQYWENQKVHYKNGKAMSIERASIDLKEILKINQNFQHKININFHSKDVEIEVVIPPRKVLQSHGFKQPYQMLQIEVFNKQHAQQVYFEDGLRNIHIKSNEIVEVQRHKYFQINNKQKLPIKLHLRLKVA